MPSETNGITSWALNLEGPIYASPTIGSDGTIYIGTDDDLSGHSGKFFAISNNVVKWTLLPVDTNYGQGGDVDGSAAIASDGTIYFLTEGHRLYALSPSGQIKWFLPIGADSEPDSSPAIGPDGTIYVGSGSLDVYAVNPDGSLKWIFDLGDIADGFPGSTQIISSPAIGSDGTIYITTGNGDPTGTLYAINPDGSQKWLFNNGYLAGCSPAIGADGTVYFGAYDNYVYAVSNNSVIRSFYTSNGIISSPAIGADGTVYIGSEDGYLYAIYGSTPLATNAPWPMFHQNPRHTGLQFPTTTPASDCGAPFVYDGTNDSMGDFTFNILATASNAWNVYASTNLTNWTQVYTNVTLTQSDGFNWNGSFTDTSVTNVAQRFYQLSNSGCSSQTIGFVNLKIVPGTNLIADQLYQVDEGVLYAKEGVLPMNTLNDLFDPFWGSAQQGAQIMAWNGQGFDGFSFFDDGIFGNFWLDTNDVESGDATLLPGIGVLINNITNAPFTNTFVGLVREKQVFQIPANTNSQPSTNYLSATLPVAGAITNITGYFPHNGDIIKLWNTNSQAYQSYTNSGSGWTPSSPVAGVGEGFVLITTNAYTWTNTWHH